MMTTQNKLLATIDAALHYIRSWSFTRSKYDLVQGSSPSAERNKVPIFEALQRFLPASGVVLEVGSFTGQHCSYFAQQICAMSATSRPRCQWQPTDYEDQRFAEIQQRVRESGEDAQAMVRTPRMLNLLDAKWEANFAADGVQLVLCSNVVHITEWQASVGLFRGSGAILGTGARLLLYGPQIINDAQHADKDASNLRFTRNLQSRNPAWGVRNLEDITKLALKHGLERTGKIDMPCNNYIIVFTKQ